MRICGKCAHQLPLISTRLARCCLCSKTTKAHYPLPNGLRRLRGCEELDGDVGPRICGPCREQPPQAAIVCMCGIKRGRSSSIDSSSSSADDEEKAAAAEEAAEEKVEAAAREDAPALPAPFVRLLRHATNLRALPAAEQSALVNLVHAVRNEHTRTLLQQRARLAKAAAVEGGRDMATGTLGGQCPVCLDDQCDALLDPCMHVSACASCAKCLKQQKLPCPRCNTRIRTIHRINI